MSLTIEKCLQAWTNSLRQMKAKADIVFFGDSLTYFGDFASVFPDKVVCNLGLRGDTIQGMIKRVEQVKMLEPKQVFLMAGINDVADCTIDSFKQQFVTLLECVIEQNSSAQFFIQSLLPVNDTHFGISCCNKDIMLCNDVIRSVAKQHGLAYMDLFSVYIQDGLLDEKETKDGIHLTEAAYCKWYKLLMAESIKSVL